MIFEVFGLDYPDGPVNPLIVLAGVLILTLLVLGGARVVLRASLAALDESVAAWAVDDLERARLAAQRGMRHAYRGDLAALAWFTLGLTAEAEGDFEAASALFSRARRAIPVGANDAQRELAVARIAAHHGFCESAMGREAPLPDPVSVEVLTDPPTAGVPSIGAVLQRFENGRALDGYLRLARSLALRRHRTSDARAVFEAAAENPWRGLLPRERLLVDALGRELRAQSPFRTEAPPVSGSAHAHWAQAVLGRSHRT